jgi:K+/H+ antiporter YhaU regulatory subunit KhtT
MRRSAERRKRLMTAVALLGVIIVFSRVDAANLFVTRIPDVTGALILAVHECDGTVAANPSSANMLKAGDRLTVIGTVYRLERLARRL